VVHAGLVSLGYDTDVRQCLSLIDVHFVIKVALLINLSPIGVDFFKFYPYERRVGSREAPGAFWTDYTVPRVLGCRVNEDWRILR